MMNKEQFFAFAMAAFLSACAFHKTPYVTYEGSPPLSGTAVFASFDEGLKTNDSRIQSVDGKSTSCSEAGCPYWVRVLPGKHVFTVRYTANHTFVVLGVAYNYSILTIEVPDMKPGHVYAAKFSEVEDRVDYTVEDLGERPRFGISLGYEGANRKYYPAEF